MLSKKQSIHLNSLADPAIIKANLLWLVQGDDLVAAKEMDAASHITCEAFSLTEANYDKLIDQVKQQSHFLGAYTEALWACYLTHCRRYTLLASHLQIHHKGKTIGEFDFLIRDNASGNIIHQELGIKFYLGLPISSNDQVFWFGPNHIDRLDLKVKHIKERQLQLSARTESHSKLRELGIAETHNIQRQSVLRGRLFKPFNKVIRAKLEKRIAQQGSHNNVQQDNFGTWFLFSEFEEFLRTSKNLENAVFSILDKPQWLSLKTREEQTLNLTETISQLQRMVADERRGIMLTVNQENLVGEESPYFIVHDNWKEECIYSIVNDSQSETPTD